MSISGLNTRQKLIQAALELFTAQGISGTTTRQIAEQAGVNEVTLFRQFGHKYGLLQAIIEEAGVLSQLEAELHAQVGEVAELLPTLQAYAAAYLTTFKQTPELVRSLIGEAGQFSPEQRRVLRQGWLELNQSLANHLGTLLDSAQFNTELPPDQLANLLLSLVLGYAVVELTCETHPVCPDHQQLLGYLERLFRAGVFPLPLDNLAGEGVTATVARDVLSGDQAKISASKLAIADLPAPLVHTILQQARKCSLQDFALAYVLFGAGLSAEDVINLQRSQQVSSAQQHLLQIATPGTNGSRQVSVNQWILGQRYGSYNSNPLSRWLRSRKDSQPAMFIDPSPEQTLTLASLQQHWQAWTAGLVTPAGEPPALFQTQHTWRVEMLSRGMSLENLCLLTGLSLTQLQPYAQRAREKLALEQATLLDCKPSSAKLKGNKPQGSKA